MTPPLVDAHASRPHYWRHLAPVWTALGDHAGTRTGWGTSRPRPIGDGPPVLVAGAADLRQIPGRRQVALLEHGAGQTYLGIDHPSYTGGRGRERVGLFLVPRQQVAEANLARYSGSHAVVVGCPALDAHFGRKIPTAPTAVLTFHWATDIGVPEAGTALPHYLPHLGQVAADLDPLGLTVIGHGHPRWKGAGRTWRQAGIPHQPDWDGALAQASVVVVDNSSAGFEAAAVGVPVVWLNDPRWRRDVEHGLRFWSHVAVGEQADGPDEVGAAVGRALRGQTPARAALAATVYERLDGRCAERTAAALVEWAS